MVGIVQPKADPWCCLHFTKYKFNVYRKKYIRSGRDSAVVGIVGKSKSLDFLKMLIFWSLVRNSVVLAVYLLFSVACFFTVHEHLRQIAIGNPLKLSPDFPPLHTVHATFTAHGAPSNSAVQGF